MRGFALAATLALFVSAAPLLAQTPPAKPPAQTPPPQAVPTPPPQPPAPFPQGAKIGIVNLQQIASLSADGKASTAKVQALIQKKQAEAAEKQKQLQANQQKLQTSGNMMNEAARTQLEKEIERQQVEAQRFQQDAQAEVNELQQELQQQFQKKLFPVLEELSKEKGLHLLLSVADAGVIWAEPGIDLTMEAVKKFDATEAKPGTKP
jgi:outer membrane protein